MAENPKTMSNKDGYVPLKKGYVPSHVQGGYKPEANIATPRPTGGTAVKPPPKKG